MVKSPGASPEPKKSKLDVYPMEMKDPQEREINQTLLLNYTTALSSFETPTEEQLVTVAQDLFRHHPNEDVEQYFRASAQWGVPAIAWNIVRPAFLWKLEFCITEFMAVEKKKKGTPSSGSGSDSEKGPETPAKEKLSIMGHKVNLIKTTPVVFHTEEAVEFIMAKAKAFEGFPFTWQRLCELLTEPMRHYTTIDKFLRAVDKVINVVTTITENGGRVFGEWEVPSNAPHHLESVFFGAVDEVEAMEMEEKQQQKSNESSTTTSSNEEPLDMSQKTSSMPAPREFAPPTAPPTAPKADEDDGEEEEKEKMEED